jgi:uncharacterized protein (TIGR00369 family)
VSGPRDLESAIAAGIDVVALMNAHRGGLERLLGLVFTSVTKDAVEAEIAVTDAILQPYGLVHGGAYATIVETLASAAAAIDAMARGQTTVGLENTTTFLRGVRSGVLRARAIPLHRGRKTQVWQVDVTDDGGRLAATGRVRTLCMDAGAAIAGETVSVKTGGA